MALPGRRLWVADGLSVCSTPENPVDRPFSSQLRPVSKLLPNGGSMLIAVIDLRKVAQRVPTNSCRSGGVR